MADSSFQTIQTILSFNGVRQRFFDKAAYYRISRAIPRKPYTVDQAHMVYWARGHKARSIPYRSSRAVFTRMYSAYSWQVAAPKGNSGGPRTSDRKPL
jgi:hypothetical protein